MRFTCGRSGLRTNVKTECKCHAVKCKVNREEKLLRHFRLGSGIISSQQTVTAWSCKCDRKKNEKNDMYEFPVYDCTQEKTVAHIFPLIVRQCK